MKVALLIPNGVGARNFLLGQFPKIASEQGEIAALHAVPESVLHNYSSTLNGRATWHPLISYPDNPLTYTLRNALSYAHMRWANTKTMAYNFSIPVRGSLRRQAAVLSGRAIGRVGATSVLFIRILDALHSLAVTLSPQVKQYRKLLRELNPSVLFCTDQRPPVILPAVLAAKSLGIPTATFIFSWDNLTSKGRIAAPFDHYLVWSEQMKSELHRFYPHVGSDRVHVIGTPQFEPHSDEGLIVPRKQFFKEIGADPERPLICYSGGDTSICPEDADHVRILMELIHSGTILGQPQVLLRPAPVDEGSRYQEVRRQFPDLIYAQPAWVKPESDDWASYFPLAEDLRFLANLIAHADLNVNVSSTMTLDFAIRDKPVVNIAFDVADPPPFGVSIWENHYQFEHYRPVVELQAARFARSPQELADHVNAYLENPALEKEGRRRFVELEVQLPLAHSSQRIIETLQSIAK